jgi:predicted Rossmann fold nucleotide-binding protein DprA/Smf involved in DNA uptake
MKLIIAGGRDLYIDGKFLDALLDQFNCFPGEIVSGGATGIDACAKAFCRYEFEFHKHYKIPYKEFSADWDKFGRAAGPIRNKLMAEYADALLIIWNNESKGSKSMINEMLKLKKPVYEVILRSHNL